MYLLDRTGPDRPDEGAGEATGATRRAAATRRTHQACCDAPPNPRR
ncbi:hypothetical protein ACFYOY_31700 [Streptomyces sp. NPDC007875]